jgi:hypothetical protein
MQGDSELRPQTPPRRDLWALPKISRVTIERRRYQPARKHTVAGKLAESTEGVEILVETDGEIPIRALSPALFVGSAEIAENEQVDARMYRFFVHDERALRAGAPIVLGWVGQPPPKAPSNFRYQAPGVESAR